jgi:hypothetical protein
MSVDYKIVQAPLDAQKDFPVATVMLKRCGFTIRRRDWSALARC